MTKKQISKLKEVEKDPIFNIEYVAVIEKFRNDNEVKRYLADTLLEDYPLCKALSVTWLVYEVCNAFSDKEIGGYLSELVVDVEDLVDDIKKIVGKYIKL